MDYSKLEQELREGNYTNVKKLTRSERVEFISHIQQWNASRAVYAALIIINNFKEV